MPKRTYEEKIDHYMKKIEKLKERGNHRRKRQRRDDSLSSSDEDDQLNNTQGGETPMWDVVDSLPGPDQTAPLPGAEETVTTPIPDEQPALPPVTPLDPTSSDSSFPPLDPDILSALGEATEQGPAWGPEIHNNLTQLWQPLLKKGMTKENKEKLFRQYLLPSNCTLLQAPKLNIEISAAVAEMVRLRDKKVETAQQQLGTGIAAISRAMTSLLTTDNKVEAIKTLSDGCRILCDLHHSETRARIKMITPGLAKPFLNVIQDSERDETLFGTSLPEKIRASKTIEKQGLQIKKNVPPARPNTTVAQNTAPARQQFQGNWTGPPRYSANRGGARRSKEVPSSIASTSADNVSSLSSSQSEPEPLTCPITPVIQTTTSTPPDPYPGSSAALRYAFSRRGAPPTTLHLMLASLSTGTLQQYGVCYKLWWQYCKDNNHSVFSESISHVVTFLTEQFEKGASYGTLNSHRSALSLLLGNNLTSNDCVKRLLKGAFKLRPSLPKYSSTWDPQLVLNHVSEWVPNSHLSLEKLTKKLVVLLALCTAHRVQTLSLIKISNIKINTNSIEIAITDIIKTSGIGRDQPVLFLPYFRQNQSICPATTLVDYMSATKDIRPLDSDHLLMTVKRPHGNATAQTISRWIKQVLCASGVDVAVYGAHSVRHSATSTAHAAGLSIDLIRKTAGWTASSQTFAKYYHRPIIQASNFAESVCLLETNESG